jgi:ABC-type lipoprotein release transport system permease subunit
VFLELRIAWRNVWRNTRRSVLTIAAIAFATVLLVFMLSWQFGSYETMINTSVKVHTGHLQVQARGYQHKKRMHLVVPEPAEVRAVLAETPGVAACTSRANAFSLVSSTKRTYGAMVIGIDPPGEARVTTLKNLIRTGSYLSSEDTNAALIGALLAENMRAGVGDELVVLGQGRDGSIAATVVRVKGIYRSGEDTFDRSSVQIPLQYFQEIYSMRGAAHQVVAVADALGDVAEIKRNVEGAIAGLNHDNTLVVLDWPELMPGLVQAIQLDLASGLVFYSILTIVVAFSILNTFLMAIFERTREFGVMMSMGTTPGRLTRLLLLESATMTVVGVVVGIVLGSFVTWYFQEHGIVIPGASELLRQYGLPERMYPRLSLLSVSIGSAVVLIITLLTALYPALRVRRLRPVEALRAI